MNNLRNLFFSYSFRFFLFGHGYYFSSPHSNRNAHHCVLIPISFYIIISPKINFPKYLTFFVLFTIYHLVSVYINGLIPPDTTTLNSSFKQNILACLLFLWAENTHLMKIYPDYERGIYFNRNYISGIQFITT